MIRGIHHVALHTPNLARIVGFYREVLGFQPVGEEVRWEKNALIDQVIGLENSAGRSIMLRAGNCYLEVFEYTSPAAREGQPLRPCDHGYTHFALDVTDIEAEYERLKAAGMVFMRDRPGEFEQLKAVYGKDPDGNIIEIQETTRDQIFSLAQLGTVSFA